MVPFNKDSWYSVVGKHGKAFKLLKAERRVL